MFIKLKLFEPQTKKEYDSKILLNLENVLTIRNVSFFMNNEIINYYEIYHTDNFSWAISENFYNKIYKCMEENKVLVEV